MKNKRIIAIGAGIITVFGLVAGAYALNEATREETCTQFYLYTRNLDVLKDPFTGKVLCETAPMGYTVNKTKQRAEKYSSIALNQKEENASFGGILLVRHKGKGIIERTFDSAVALVKAR